MKCSKIKDKNNKICYTDNKDNKGILLIDVSSWLYWVLFSLRNRYITLCEKKKNNVYKNFDDYVSKNSYRFMKESILRFHKTHGTSKVIFAFDSPRANIWRTQYFDEYKSQRRKLTRHRGEDVNFIDILTNIYENILERLSMEINAFSIKIEEAEADDVIAVLVKKISKNNVSNSKIVIMADDYDYFQLLNYPFVSAFNFSGKDFREIIHSDPKKYLRYKILRGDRSDNIPRCQRLDNNSENEIDLSKFNNEEKLRLLNLGLLRIRFICRDEIKLLEEDPKLIIEWMDNDPIFQKDWIRNSYLIDMLYIPKEIENTISSMLKNEYIPFQIPRSPSPSPIFV